MICPNKKRSNFKKWYNVIHHKNITKKEALLINVITHRSRGKASNILICRKME